MSPLPRRMPLVRLIRLTLSLAVLIYVSGCATNPVTGGSDFVLMSETEELTLGARYHQQIIKEMPVYPDQKLASYVDNIGQRLARESHRPQLAYQFTVLDSTQVNAFALPGGYIYITRGLLAYLNSEAELAAVLGHEIGHVTARHSVRQHSATTAAGMAGILLQATTGISGSQDLFNVVGKAILSGYGREHELESDRLGAQYLARSGYSPDAMLDVIGVLKNQELIENERAREQGREPRAYHGVFASHPENDRRLQEVVGEAGQLKTSAATRVGRAEFLAHIDGLAFGDSENEGVVRNNTFLHRPLDFGLDIPERWRIENLPDQLLIIAPQESAFMQIKVDSDSGEHSPRRYLAEKGVRNLRSAVSLDIKGLPAYTGETAVVTDKGERQARVAALRDGKQTFLFTGVSRNDQHFNQHDKVFLEILHSYHKLDSREQELAKGLRLKIIKLDSGTRFADLARRSPIENQAEAELRLLNGQYPDGEPGAGESIKVVR